MDQAQAFQPIENYGVIGNMRSIALVGMNGSIDFLCFPDLIRRLFLQVCSIRNAEGISGLIRTFDNMRTRQLYLPDTNILLTRFLSDDGVAEITDFMPVVEDKDRKRYGHHILRMISVIKGEVRFNMRCAPRFDYARSEHKAVCEDKSICFVPASKGCPSMALHATFPDAVRRQRCNRCVYP